MMAVQMTDSQIGETLKAYFSYRLLSPASCSATTLSAGSHDHLYFDQGFGLKEVLRR